MTYLIFCMTFLYLNFSFLINKNEDDLCPFVAPRVVVRRERGIPGASAEEGSRGTQNAIIEG